MHILILSKQIFRCFHSLWIASKQQHSSTEFRYWSITDIYYSQKRTPKRIFTMLMLIWVVSLLISVAPIFGWKDDHFVERVRENHVCLISQEISYQVFRFVCNLITNSLPFFIKPSPTILFSTATAFYMCVGLSLLNLINILTAIQLQFYFYPPIYL